MMNDRELHAWGLETLLYYKILKIKINQISQFLEA